MKRVLVSIAVLAALAGQSAFAVSDGHYSPANQGCTGDADNSDHPTRVEPGCHALTAFLADGTGHQYIGYGLDQAADGDEPHVSHIWIDPGQGTRYTWTFDFMAPDQTGAPEMSTGTAADPSTGIKIYFGADDNLDQGEHDSSEQVSNGPSDGGGITVDITPAAAQAWAATLQAADTAGLLAAPVPIDGGFGACADGLCISVGTQRRVAFEGGYNKTHHNAPKHRDVANYSGKVWDPYDCAGPSDSAARCSDATHAGYTMKDWYNLEGTTYVEPGIQIYEDPDPQGSPGVIGLIGLDQRDPYPLPALYLGTCGVIFGGGPADSPTRFDGQPNTNDAGQIVIPTGCN